MITLKTLPQATAQEVFDQVATHLLTQKEKSGEGRSNGRVCFYLSPNGYRCAAGCLIGDDEKAKELDKLLDEGFHGSDWKTLANNKLVPMAHAKLISALQSVHDNMEVDEWEQALRALAKQKALKFSGPKDAPTP